MKLGHGACVETGHVGVQQNDSTAPLLDSTVHADEDAQHVGLQIEGVLLPALLQVEYGAAADAAVDEVELEFGEGRAVLGGEKKYIAVPEDVVRVGPAAPCHVGDRVALEQDAGLNERGGWRFGLGRGDRRERQAGEEEREAMFHRVES